MRGCSYGAHIPHGTNSPAPPWRASQRLTRVCPLRAAVITAERAIKRKLALARAADGAEDDASDGGGDAPERDGDWGASRKDYYDDEGVDVDVRCAFVWCSVLAALLSNFVSRALRTAALCAWGRSWDGPYD